MQIVNWKSHLKFPEEVKLSPEAKDLIVKLLCNVNQRLGSNGAYEIKVSYGVSLFEFLNVTRDLDIVVTTVLHSSQAHPFFEGVEWDKLYHMDAAFIPEVNDDLDTQNFEKFEEVFRSFRFSLI